MTTTRPLILAVDGDPSTRPQVTTELTSRYGAAYDVVIAATAAEACAGLAARSTSAGGGAVALVLAPLGDEGAEVLAAARADHPRARRGFLLDWGQQRAQREELARALAALEADYFVTKPTAAPDEQFHRGITEFLDEWWRLHGRASMAIRIVGCRSDARSHELVDMLHRHDLPARWIDADSGEGREALAAAGLSTPPLPVVLLRDGRVLLAPSIVEAANALGARTSPRRGVYDVAIIGGGPAGLAAAVYASSEGLRTALIERSAMGGQAGTSSMIRNYLGFPRGISGAELAQRSFDQAIQFGTEMIYGAEVAGLRTDGDLRVVELADGRSVPARAVIVATGVTYRRLEIPSLAPFEGTSVFYGSAMSEAPNVAGREVVVVGGGNSAGQAALHLAKFAARVTMLVRSSSLAASMSAYLITELANTANVEIRHEAEVVGGEGADGLEGVVVRDVRTRAEEVLPAAALFVLIGAEPHTDWMPPEVVRDEWGYVVADTGAFATSLPGVFVVGDVRRGAVKRVASAAGAGAVSVHQVHEYLRTLPIASGGGAGGAEADGDGDGSHGQGDRLTDVAGGAEGEPDGREQHHLQREAAGIG
jgi:thioredoxin reductase (NADPH)